MEVVQSIVGCSASSLIFPLEARNNYFLHHSHSVTTKASLHNVYCPKGETKPLPIENCCIVRIAGKFQALQSFAETLPHETIISNLRMYNTYHWKLLCLRGILHFMILAKMGWKRFLVWHHSKAEKSVDLCF